MNLHGLLTKLFELEEINGADRCPTYLYRWKLLSTPWAKAYLHKFVAEDWSKDLHDHPKRFLTIGIKGGYIEHSYFSPDVIGSYTAKTVKAYTAPWIRSFAATHAHRLTLLPDQKPCWTIAVVFKTVRPWGFIHGGKWIPWREYVDSETADKMKSCS